MPDSLVLFIIGMAAIFFVIVWFRRRIRAAQEIRAAYQADPAAWATEMLRAMLKAQAFVFGAILLIAALIWVSMPSDFGEDFPVFAAAGSVVLFAGFDIWLLLLRRRAAR